MRYSTLYIYKKVNIAGDIVSVVNYNTYNFRHVGPLSFKANEQGGLDIVTKPIDKVESIVNNTVDSFVPESQNEEKKNSHKNAIRVGSTVLVLSAIVALLNPKFSSSLVNKLKTKSTKAANKAKVDNSFWGKWNKGKEKVFNGMTNLIQILNNANSFKDEMFQKLCNKTLFTRKIHKSITEGFDKISKQTVFWKHKRVTKQMNTLDDIISQYKNRLSDTEKMIFDEKLEEINKLQEYFNPENITYRLQNQEGIMQNLEKDVIEKMVEFKNGFKLNGGKNLEHSKNACRFWAEDILMPKRNKIEEDGLQVINALVGDGKTTKGAYRELIELLHLNPEEKLALEESIKQTGKALHKANKVECVEYFDKKRDLMLGSAPTDVLTALAGLTASGIAIGVADTKQDRISRAITGAFPVIAGLGVSTALTAMLFSGGKGMALGAASSMILSGIGSSINRTIFPNNRNDVYLAEKKSKGEVKNA